MTSMQIYETEATDTTLRLHSKSRPLVYMYMYNYSITPIVLTQ